MDETLAQLSGAKVFTKLDANSGFWQIPLSEQSRLLTTFIIPMGRFCFNKLPFRISSAPEHFQKCMPAILEGLPGVVCQMDDVLIHGKDQAEHDSRLLKALTRIKFVEHIVDSNGITANPDKMKTLEQMGKPINITELRRFLGTMNQLGKFSPNLAQTTQLLCELHVLGKKSIWVWDTPQATAFKEVKRELTATTTIALYDPAADMKVSADASAYRLGVVLQQKYAEGWKHVAYASRSFSEKESRYDQIE